MRDLITRLAYVTVTTVMAVSSLAHLSPWVYVPTGVLILLWTVHEVAPRESAPPASHPAIADFSPGPRGYHRRDILLLHYQGVEPGVAAGLQAIRCAELAFAVERAAHDSTRWSDEGLIALEHAAGVAVRDYIELRRWAADHGMERGS